MNFVAPQALQPAPADGALALQLMRPNLGAAADLAPYLLQIEEAAVYSNFGPLCRALEAALGQRFRTPAGAVPAVCLVTSGTVALTLALVQRLGPRPAGRLVLCPAYTFAATPHAIVNAGHVPHFVDCAADDLMVSPAIAREAMAGLPRRPAAIVVVSAFGAPLDVAAWEAFEAETDVAVVFDGAGRTEADTVGAQPLCLSLHATKLIGIGEGGAVVSTDGAFVERLRRATNFSFDPATRVAAAAGGNYKVSEVAAAVGLANLASLEQRLERLHRLGAAYAEALAGTPVAFQPGRIGGWLSSTLNVVVPADRVALTEASLGAARVPWRRWWGSGCHTHAGFADVACADLASTGAVAQRVIGVPFHLDVSPAHVEVVCRALRRACN